MPKGAEKLITFSFVSLKFKDSFGHFSGPWVNEKSQTNMKMTGNWINEKNTLSLLTAIPVSTTSMTIVLDIQTEKT